ncbi:MAG: hypothetical protein ABR885_10900 [Mycobacterium sp.]
MPQCWKPGSHTGLTDGAQGGGGTHGGAYRGGGFHHGGGGGDGLHTLVTTFHDQPGSHCAELTPGGQLGS